MHTHLAIADLEILREHLQTDFSMLNIIVTLTSLPPSLTSRYENYAMTIEAQTLYSLLENIV